MVILSRLLLHGFLQKFAMKYSIKQLIYSEEYFVMATTCQFFFPLITVKSFICMGVVTNYSIATFRTYVILTFYTPEIIYATFTNMHACTRVKTIQSKWCNQIRSNVVSTLQTTTIIDFGKCRFLFVCLFVCLFIFIFAGMQKCFILNRKGLTIFDARLSNV